MSFVVMPCWEGPDGVLSGTFYRPVETQAAARELVERGFRDARAARGTNPRILIGDDLTGRTLFVVKPRRPRA